MNDNQGDNILLLAFVIIVSLIVVLSVRNAGASERSLYCVMHCLEPKTDQCKQWCPPPKKRKERRV